MRVSKSGDSLPQSWYLVGFEDAFEVVSDEGKRIAQSGYLEVGMLPVIDQGESFIGGYTNDLDAQYTGPLPLVIFGDHTRRVKYVEQRFAVGAQGVKLLLPTEGFAPRYLAHLIPILPLPDRGYSRHFQFLRRLQFPMPPRPEQDRIVEEIEKQFTRLDAAVAALKRVQANLKRYRAAVLKAACEGRLVPTEAELARKGGRGYETGEQFLARILKDRHAKWEANQLAKKHAAGKPPKNEDWKKKYKEPEAPDTSDLPPLPEGWMWAPLDVLAEIKGGLTKGQQRRPTDDLRSVPYLRVANVQRGYLDLEEIKEIAATEAEIVELQLQPGDVLFNEGGDRDKLGRGWVWEGQISLCIHQNHVFRARLYSSGVQPRFLSWYANTFGQRYFFDEGKQTTNLASVNMTKLKALPVPIPPASEQERILLEVERQLSELDNAVTAVEASESHADRLRQSILKCAFEGKLVPQDPRDEPVSVLLERIRAERADRSRFLKNQNEASNIVGQVRRKNRKNRFEQEPVLE